MLFFIHSKKVEKLDLEKRGVELTGQAIVGIQFSPKTLTPLRGC